MNPHLNRAIGIQKSAIQAPHPSMNPFYKPKQQAISEPNPASPDHAAKLAALKSPPDLKPSNRRLADIKSPFPDPPKVVKFYFYQGDEGTPAPPYDDPNWQPSPHNAHRTPDKKNTIYEYYKYNNPNPPKYPPNPAWEEWLARDAEKNRLRTLQDEDIP